MFGDRLCEKSAGPGEACKAFMGLKADVFEFRDSQACKKRCRLNQLVVIVGHCRREVQQWAGIWADAPNKAAILSYGSLQLRCLQPGPVLNASVMKLALADLRVTVAT